ncbi:MAG: M23 family metallopeptidase [Rikenellaceae bacterium]
MLEKEQSFDTQTIVKEVVVAPFRLRTYRAVRHFLVGFILVSIANMLFSYLFDTPKLYKLYNENQELLSKYKLLEGRVSVAQNKLQEIRHRDNHVYRSLFGIDTLASTLSQMSYPAQKYASFEGDSYALEMTSLWQKLDQFAVEIYEQSLSLDELQRLTQNKEELAMAIPAIWPIDRTRLKSGIGAFGMRRHPIYGRYIMHKGIDLAADIGTPIYATADGVVESTSQGYRSHGYGQQVLLNHDFGYKTRYAHLSKRLVQKGDTVRRGEIIGQVGSTGGSTGPHLHYEVIHKGVVVNPINYFNRNMTNDEYRDLMDQLQDTKFDTFD